MAKENVLSGESLWKFSKIEMCKIAKKEVIQENFSVEIRTIFMFNGFSSVHLFFFFFLLYGFSKSHRVETNKQKKKGENKIR